MIKIFHRQAYTWRERILFLRQLALILQSGLPILQAMELLRKRLDKRLQLMCLHLHQLLGHGSSLAEAMAQEQQFFPTLAVQLVQAGELSGQLGAVLNELADYYQQQEQLRSFIWKAAMYPLFLLTAALGVLLFFLLYVLPMLASVYRGMRLQPNGSMELLLRVHDFLVNNPLLIAGMLVATVMLARFYGKRLLLWLLGKPWCGNFYGLLCEIRFCKLLALLLDSGLSITIAVQAIAKTMAESPYQQQLLLLDSRLQRGADITASLAGMRGLLSPLTLDLVSVGAATGCLPQMLREAARLGQQDMQSKIAKLREVLAPLLLLLAAGVIAAVVCAVLGPLLEMLSALPQ
ncbi:MAG: type II secretion system F family protein [Phascolarctobacterium sp.]